MKSNYQKYYDALKGKDFTSKVTNYKSALSNSNSKLSSVESTIGSSQWIEKGLEIIKSSVLPSLKEQGNQLDNGLNALSQAAAKVNDLVSQLTQLDELEKKLENLGSEWTYVEGGTRTESEVNNHNSEINKLKGDITSQESAIDATIAAINGISFDFSSKKANFSTQMSGIKDAITEYEESKKYQGSWVFNSNSIINKKIQDIVGDVDDPNNYDPVIPNLYSARKDILVIDTDTGQTYNRDDAIEMKEGEVKHLIVKLPTNTGMIQKITRTTAANNNSTITKTWSDVDPDPNKRQYVRRYPDNHWPNNNPNDPMLHSNCYEWVIQATGTGQKTLSQTVEYTTDASKGVNLKAMTRITVKINK